MTDTTTTSPLTANDVAEQVTRTLLTSHPEIPVRAEFYRGITHRAGLLDTVYEKISTPAYRSSGWFVRLLPAGREVVVNAAGAPGGFFGPDLLGEVLIVKYPLGPDGRPDLAAMVGDGFYADLMEAVEAKHAEITADRCTYEANR